MNHRAWLCDLSNLPIDSRPVSQSVSIYSKKKRRSIYSPKLHRAALSSSSTSSPRLPAEARIRSAWPGAGDQIWQRVGEPRLCPPGLGWLVRATITPTHQVHPTCLHPGTRPCGCGAMPPARGAGARDNRQRRGVATFGAEGRAGSAQRFARERLIPTG